VVLAYPDVGHDERDGGGAAADAGGGVGGVLLAVHGAGAPVAQGIRACWERRGRTSPSARSSASCGAPGRRSTGPRAAGGWLLVEQLRVARKRAAYPPELVRLYERTLRERGDGDAAAHALRGPGEWSVFAPPRPLRDLGGVQALPGATAADVCVVVPPDLWRAFRDVSLWVEALCIHEWSQFTERVSGTARGEAYALLTERPDNRLPLDWERNQVDLLMLEGRLFACPWTGTRLTPGATISITSSRSVYPFHELWNLVPSQPAFNRTASARACRATTPMAAATPRLVETYARYTGSTRSRRRCAPTSRCASRAATRAPRPWPRRYDRW
jgi:hypothetical protein